MLKKIKSIYSNKTSPNLGMMFSYLFRNDKDDKNGVDYALITPITNIIYDFITKNGKSNYNDLDEESFCTVRNDSQVGYDCQENSISQIPSNLNSKEFIIFHKISLWNMDLQKIYSIIIYLIIQQAFILSP